MSAGSPLRQRSRCAKCGAFLQWKLGALQPCGRCTALASVERGMDKLHVVSDAWKGRSMQPGKRVRP